MFITTVGDPSSALRAPSPKGEGFLISQRTQSNHKLIPTTSLRGADDVPGEADDLSVGSPFRRITRRRRIEDPYHRKVLIPAELVRGRSCSIAQGNHSVWVGSGPRAEKLPAEPTELLALAHFPIRSSYQFRKKVLIGWPSNVARSHKKPDDCYHWQEHFDRCRKGPLSPQELGAIGRSYSLKFREPGSQALIEDPFAGYEPFETRTHWPENEGEETLLLELVAEQSMHLALGLSHAAAALETLGRAGIGEWGELASRLLGFDDHLGQIFEELQTQRSGLEAKLEKERRELTHLLGSKSWRWTRPLRMLERWRRGS